MAFRQPPQPPFYKKGLLDGSFSIVSTNTPTANATQQGLICDSGQRATAVPIAHQRVAEDCLADTLDREGSSVWAGLRFPHGSAQGAQPGRLSWIKAAHSSPTALRRARSRTA